MPERPIWKPLSRTRTAKLRNELARALVPMLSGPEAEATAIVLVEGLADGSVRDVFRLVCQNVDASVERPTLAALVALYLGHAVDSSVEQRDDEELLGDAGVPSELIDSALELAGELQKGRAA
jgi:hypothetical protein